MIQDCLQEDRGAALLKSIFSQLVPAKRAVWRRRIFRSESLSEPRQAPSFQPIGIDGYF